MSETKKNNFIGRAFLYFLLHLVMLVALLLLFRFSLDIIGQTVVSLFMLNIAYLLLIAISAFSWLNLCGMYAQKKGFSAIFGILIGLIWIPGFIVLLLLPPISQTAPNTVAKEGDKTG